MWIITKDLVDGGKSVGVSSKDYEETKAALLTEQFRLLDGDKHVYYEGLSNDASSEEAFAPLDDFGQGFSGCTSVEYLEHDVWRPL